MQAEAIFFYFEHVARDIVNGIGGRQRFGGDRIEPWVKVSNARPLGLFVFVLGGDIVFDNFRSFVAGVDQFEDHGAKALVGKL